MQALRVAGQLDVLTAAKAAVECARAALVTENSTVQKCAAVRMRQLAYNGVVHLSFSALCEGQE
jgi:hypothetical protein